MKKLAGLVMVIMGIIILAVSLGFNLFNWMQSAESKDQQESVVYDGEADTIEFDVRSQDVMMTRHEKDTLEVQSRGQDNIVVSDNSDKVVIRQDKTSWLPLLSFGTRSKWEVNIPASFSGKVIVNGGSSDVDFDNGNKGQIRSLQVDVGSGDVDIGALTAADLQLSAKSGDLTIEAVESEQSTFKTISGDMEIDQFQGPMTATLTSGTIDVAFKQFDESNIKVTSGDVNVSVGEADIHLDCSVASGDIRNELQLDSVEHTQRRLTGEKGSAGEDLIIEAVSGDIHVQE